MVEMGAARHGHKVLFLGKKGDPACANARAWCDRQFAPVQYHEGDWGDAFPEAANQWQGDLIISYLSRWIVPASVLSNAKVAAINFHPATPEYPGIGCNNFALYEGAETYGATCHHMSSAVDTGRIIQVTRFQMASDETVASLLLRTYGAMFDLFMAVMTNYGETGQFAESAEQWTRPPFTRRQFEALRLIEPDMSVDEVQRRVRATFYPPWGPKMMLHGYVFNLQGTEQ